MFGLVWSWSTQFHWSGLGAHNFAGLVSRAHMCVCVCASACACACVCVCVHVCACMCLCVRVGGPSRARQPIRRGTLTHRARRRPSRATGGSELAEGSRASRSGSPTRSRRPCEPCGLADRSGANTGAPAQPVAGLWSPREGGGRGSDHTRIPRRSTGMLRSARLPSSVVVPWWRGPVLAGSVPLSPACPWPLAGFPGAGHKRGHPPSIFGDWIFPKSKRSEKQKTKSKNHKQGTKTTQKQQEKQNQTHRTHCLSCIAELAG